jgi:hypothetical protein
VIAFRQQGHDMAVDTCGVDGARGLERREPKRRMGLLQRLCCDPHALEVIVFAGVIDDVAGQCLEHDLGRLAVHLWRLRRVDRKSCNLDRRGAAAQPEFETAAAHVVEHHHFLGHPQRMVHRRDVEERPEAQPRRALCHRGQKDAGGGRHAERRRVMLGDVVGAEA